MNFGLSFAVACGLTAFVTLSAPASATTFTYDLVGNTNAAYTDPAWPGWSYIDTKDAGTGATSFPSYSVHVGDTFQVTVTLNNPVTFNTIDLFLQEASDDAGVWFDQTVLFSLGGATVPNPATGFWNGSAGSTGGLGFGPGFWPDAGTLTVDKVIVNAVVTLLTNPLGNSVSSVELTQFPTYIGFYNTPVAQTPLPGAMLLMMTALGGLGVVGWRKRTASA
jgi:hypothetical protein